MAKERLIKTRSRKKGRGTVGRPPKWGPEAFHKIEVAASYGCTMPEIALHAGISLKTLYEWKDEKIVGDGSNKTLGERIKELRNKPILKARETVVKRLDDLGNAHWYLEKKLPHEFGSRTKVDASLSGTVSLVELFKASKTKEKIEE